MPASAIIALLQVLVQFAPQIPEIVSAVETAVRLTESGDEPTDAEMASFEAATLAAHAALQAS